ncbi:MAG: (d)CMP kinase [Bacteroidota bacterium]|nr:(d)CMP kinase [Bacteroidota bacterium]MDP4230294.1 (d)CMP kinase [Bacteroidota bacterium]MDP4235619.1 (d)CMP kinase [Bacteroidota bacterium]
MRHNGIILAIDGPTASGKSTTAREVAKRLSYIHINTGAMYRAFALYASEWGVTSPDDPLVGELSEKAYIDFDEGGNILLEGRDVSKDIQAPAIAQLASELATLPIVREKMVAMQQEIGKNGGVVLDGRDIGTVVFPDAELKIFLIANAKTRAERRRAELASNGTNLPLEELTREIEERDRRDAEREHSPLKKASDAVELDTSKLTFEQQVEKVVNLAKKVTG